LHWCEGYYGEFFRRLARLDVEARLPLLERLSEPNPCSKGIRGACYCRMTELLKTTSQFWSYANQSEWQFSKSAAGQIHSRFSCLADEALPPRNLRFFLSRWAQGGLRNSQEQEAITVEANQNSAANRPQINPSVSGLESLKRAVSGRSFLNFPAIFEGFAAKGIPESKIKSRENIITFQTWKALVTSLASLCGNINFGVESDLISLLSHRNLPPVSISPRGKLRLQAKNPRRTA
jgi:hypothetical protein